MLFSSAGWNDACDQAGRFQAAGVCTASQAEKSADKSPHSLEERDIGGDSPFFARGGSGLTSSTTPPLELCAAETGTSLTFGNYVVAMPVLQTMGPRQPHSFARSAAQPRQAIQLARRTRHGEEKSAGSREWDWHGWRSTSPRARPFSPRARPKGGKAAQGPKGKPKQGPKGATGLEQKTPKPPQTEALPAPPTSSQPAMPSTTTSIQATETPTMEQALLKALVAHVASQENTPSELQQLLGQYQDDSHRATGKNHAQVGFEATGSQTRPHQGEVRPDCFRSCLEWLHRPFGTAAGDADGRKAGRPSVLSTRPKRHGDSSWKRRRLH